MKFIKKILIENFPFQIMRIFSLLIYLLSKFLFFLFLPIRIYRKSNNKFSTNTLILNTDSKIVRDPFIVNLEDLKIKFKQIKTLELKNLIYLIQKYRFKYILILRSPPKNLREIIFIKTLAWHYSATIIIVNAIHSYYIHTLKSDSLMYGNSGKLIALDTNPKKLHRLKGNKIKMSGPAYPPNLIDDGMSKILYKPFRSREYKIGFVGTLYEARIKRLKYLLDNGLQIEIPRIYQDVLHGKVAFTETMYAMRSLEYFEFISNCQFTLNWADLDEIEFHYKIEKKKIFKGRIIDSLSCGTIPYYNEKELTKQLVDPNYFIFFENEKDIIQKVNNMRIHKYYEKKSLEAYEKYKIYQNHNFWRFNNLLFD